jgi:DNA primase
MTGGEKRFDDNLLSFIKNNILITDLAENYLNLEKNRKKSTKQYAVYNYIDDKIIVNNNKNTFFTANNTAGGNIFDFVMYVKNTDFVNAVKIIAAYYNINIDNENNNIDYDLENENFKRIKKQKEQKENELKKINEKAKRDIYIYENLKQNAEFDTDIRAISAELLNFLKNSDYIKHYKNDKYDIIKVPLYKYNESGNAEIVGIQDVYFDVNNKKWQKINKGSAGIYTAGNLKNCDKIVMTEAFFDAISAYEFSYNNKIKKNKFYTYTDLINNLAICSTNGSLSDLKKESIVNILKNHDNINTLILAFDDDDVGKKYEKEILNLLKENNINNIDIVKINYNGKKDLNELLQAKKTKEQEIKQKDVINKVKKMFKPSNIEIA